MLRETEELTEEVVRELIENTYCKRYIGQIRLKTLTAYDGTPTGYRVSMDLGNPERPLELAFDGNSEEFLTLLEKKLREKHLADDTYSYGLKGFTPEDVSVNPRLAKL